MAESKVFKNSELDTADLVVDAIYQGGDANNLSSAPLPDLLDVGNVAGFRKKKISNNSSGFAYIVLFSNFAEPDWPDNIDSESGVFTYYGDNREPGSALHDKDGNKTLKHVFDNLHSGNRDKIPPFFIFTKTQGDGYDKRFRGLAVPGYQTENQSEDLVAVWKNKGGNRFQNYKAKFTILEIERISREWIEDLQRGEFLTENAPIEWVEWAEHGKYEALEAERTRDHRNIEEQKPSTPLEREVLHTIYTYFEGDPTDFEGVAASIFELMDPNVGNYEVTRNTRDGGRDAVGQYNIGPETGSDSDNLAVEFALEAKCHKPNSGNGVKEISRLISRLRYRQFGIFVTTSYVGEQAYKEIKEDGHPVLIISGGDIAKILIKNGFNTVEAVETWLENQAG